MKKPYIANYSENVNLNNDCKIYYDSKEQISYKDEEKTIKAINASKFGNTLETCTIENSDPDEMFLTGSTKLTFTIEDSDPDEFNTFGSTRLTKSIEDSDPDEYIKLSTTQITETVEDSDPDEYYLC